MKKKITYLLSGNGSIAAWWQYTTPHFTNSLPVPLELPGFGSNSKPLGINITSYAQSLLDTTKSGHDIVACGINALIVLHAAVLRPKHFRKIILYGPIGAFLWQRQLPKLLAFTPLQQLVKILLSYFPIVFKSLFTTQPWPKKDYALIANGYRQCKSFCHYFSIIKPHNALTLLDTLTVNIHIAWGLKDKIANPRHAAAWESILPRAKLGFSFIEEWGHYPYIEKSKAFAKLIESNARPVNAHTKAGRLHLARTCGLLTPKFWVANNRNTPDILAQLPTERIHQWAIRSSSDTEDQYMKSNAGLSKTYLGVHSKDINQKTNELVTPHTDVIIQEYIAPLVSGVAFVRHISTEIEWVKGHLADLVQGAEKPQRVIVSKLGGEWENCNLSVKSYNMDLKACVDFLQKVSRTFHYAPLDIEWAWDGEQFYLFQLRPVTNYQWRRNLTSANIDELLPSQPSYLMEQTQRLTSYSIPQIYALWDTSVLKDSEPFTCRYDNSSYLNSDLFLSRLHDWGLPSKLYSKLIGGTAPMISGNFYRFVKNLPTFLRMQIKSRRYIKIIYSALIDFEAQLNQISNAPQHSRQELCTNWFLRFYVFVVQTNIILNAAIVTALGNWYGRPVNAYKAVNPATYPHRVKYETDPASPRPNKAAMHCEPPVKPTMLDSVVDNLLLPGNQNYYIELREWFRNNYTKLYHQLHLQLSEFEKIKPHWFLRHTHPRKLAGSFWQDTGHSTLQTDNSLIYPGDVTGLIGQEILIVDSLDPGQYHYYRSFKAVIARLGGRLSHGAILLRELKIPSAIIPDLPSINTGTKIHFSNGTIFYFELITDKK